MRRRRQSERSDGTSVGVLAVGAHPDDIELGCGATLRGHVLAGDRVAMLVMCDGEAGPGADPEQRRAEQREAAQRLGARLLWGERRDGSIEEGFPTVRVVERVIEATGAEIVYTHAPDDSHQDHRAVSRAVTSAARAVARVLFYESPSSYNFQPQVYVDVTGCAKDKLAALAAHTSQVAGSNKVDLEVVEALMRVRGFAAGVRDAEGFTAHRLVLDPRDHS